MKKISITLVILIGLSSCSNYYKAVLAPKPATAGSIEDLKTKNRYFILRDGNRAFTMNNISLSADQKTMHCNLDSLPYIHTFHLTNRKMKYKKPVNAEDDDETLVLNEVHVYINSNGNAGLGQHDMLLNEIQKIEVIEKDKIKTRKSHTTGTIIGVGGTVLVIGIIAALSISSSLSKMH